jgi:DNA polymerase-3 subunit delta
VIHLLHGSDDFRIRERVREIASEITADGESLEGNVTTFDGRSVLPGELLAAVMAVPFLGAHRLVVVEGLLAAIGEARGGGRRKKTDDDPLAPWSAAAKTLGAPGGMPETTTLVLVEGELKKTNAAFSIFAPISRVVELGPLDTQALSEWMKATAARHGATLAGRSIPALAQLIGPDLWVLETEIAKLAAYAGGEPIEPEMIAELVTAAQETKVWEVGEALVVGDEERALRAMRRLVADGEPIPIISSLVTRQFRQLVIVKDMRERGARADDVVRAAGIPPFRLSAIGALANRYSWPLLRQTYARLLEADLSVKRGLQDDQSALQLLVHDVCAAAPAGAQRPASSRPAARPRR